MRADARARVAHSDERVFVREYHVARPERQTLEHRVYACTCAAQHSTEILLA